METRELLEGEAWIGPEGDYDAWVMTSREWAAKILGRASEYAIHGSFPSDLSAFDLGRAVGRALSNSNDEDPLAEVMRGYTHYLVAKRHPKS